MEDRTSTGFPSGRGFVQLAPRFDHGSPWATWTALHVAKPSWEEPQRRSSNGKRILEHGPFEQPGPPPVFIGFGEMPESRPGVGERKIPGKEQDAQRAGRTPEEHAEALRDLGDYVKAVIRCRNLGLLTAIKMGKDDVEISTIIQRMQVPRFPWRDVVLLDARVAAQIPVSPKPHDGIEPTFTKKPWVTFEESYSNTRSMGVYGGMSSGGGTTVKFHSKTKPEATEDFVVNIVE